MLNKLTIPETITVGFQKRPGTYTGKLAYVIYTDAKGVLRKEKSWNSWRDQKLPKEEFENKPTSGFVLNKKVGETRWGWNPRKAWFRVWDPRDFEFEISGANLLFILEECTSTKGKGLEGEFVYSWDGTELVLLPVGSQEYKNSAEFGSLQTKKISKTDVKEGCIYLTKDKKQVMYLGRHDWYGLVEQYGTGDNVWFKTKHEKQHVFLNMAPLEKKMTYEEAVEKLGEDKTDELDTDGYFDDSESKATGPYWIQSGFTKLASKLTEEPSSQFATAFEEFKNSVYGSKPIEIVAKPCRISKKALLDDVYDFEKRLYLKRNDRYYTVSISSWSGIANKHRLTVSDMAVTCDETGIRIGHPETSKEKTFEEISNMDFYTLQIKTENGALLQV